jgi:hypothetical protein
MDGTLRRVKMLGIAVDCALVVLALAAGSASASQDVCSAIPKATFAKIVGLPHSSAEAGPGNGGTITVASCELDAWSGSKPRGKQIASREQKGTVALLEISTISEVPAGAQATWEQEAAKIPVGIKNEFQRFGFGPKAFTPPTLGADTSGGYTGAERSVREIRGYWSSTSNRTAVLVTIIHANKKLAPVQAELIKAATSIVPALGI